MKTISSSMIKLFSTFCFCAALMSCGSGSSIVRPDSVELHDQSANSIGAKVVLPTSSKKWQLYAEHQRVKGEALQYYGPKTKGENSPSGTVDILQRPELTTKDSFTLSETSLGTRWDFVRRNYWGMNWYFNLNFVNSSVNVEQQGPSIVAQNRYSLKASDAKMGTKLEFFIPIKDSLRLSASESFNPDFSWGLTDSMSISRVAIEYDFTKKMTFALGVKRFSYVNEGRGDGESNLPVDQLNFVKDNEIIIHTKGYSLDFSYNF